MDSDDSLGGMTGRSEKYRSLNGLTCGGSTVSLCVKFGPACSALDVRFSQSCCRSERTSSFKIGRNSFYGEEVAASSHKRVCAGEL